MRNLSSCRQAVVDIAGKSVLLLPEFELTDFPTDVPLKPREADKLLRSSGADVSVAGFVEQSGDGRRFSSCLVVDGDAVHLVRKYAPYPTEVGMIDGSEEEPDILPLSIGFTIVFLCSDLGRFCTEERFLEKCRDSGVQVGLLISAWKHNFAKSVALMTRFQQHVGLDYCFIMDRFNGLVTIPLKHPAS